MARRDRRFLQEVPFNRDPYGSIVQTSHPGAHDAAYRERVRRLVEASEAAWPNIPAYDYAAAEHEVWRFVSELLVRLQDRYACQAYLEGREKLALPLDHVPQLDAVSARIEAETGFMLAPVGGLLESGEFLSTLRHKLMRCTPYVRHPAFPFFTPEPDIVHELRGHAPMFMHKPFVEMSAAIGAASQAAIEAGNKGLLETIALFYWYTVEYGLIRERGEVRVFGSGNNAGIQDLLRSVDPGVEKRPLKLEDIRRLSIDYDEPQQLFFVAEGYAQIEEMANALMRMA